jgi:uncharacterized membrane protein
MLPAGGVPTEAGASQFELVDDAGPARAAGFSPGAGGAAHASRGSSAAAEPPAPQPSALEHTRSAPIRYEVERSSILLDAVVAIAVSLLGVKLPEIGDFSAAAVARQVGVYIWSFWLTFSLWRDHASTVPDEDDSQPVLFALNALWVYCVSCVPLTTLLLVSSAPQGDSPPPAFWVTWARSIIGFVTGAAFFRALSDISLQREVASAPPPPQTSWPERLRHPKGEWTLAKRFVVLVVELLPAALALGLTYAIPLAHAVYGSVVLILREPLGLFASRVLCAPNQRPPVPRRLRVFQITDGVFAICMTLLSVEVAPALVAGYSLYQVGLIFVNYTMCFFALLYLWHLNNGLFQFLEPAELNRWVFRLNFLALTMIPVATGGFKSMANLVLEKSAESAESPHGSAHPARRASAAEHGNATEAPTERALSQHDQRRMALLYATIPVLIWLAVQMLLQIYCIAVFGYPEPEEGLDKVAGGEHEHGRESEHERKRAHHRLVRLAHRRHVWSHYYLLRCVLLALLTAIVVGLGYYPNTDGFTLLWVWVAAAAAINIMVWLLHAAVGSNLIR